MADVTTSIRPAKGDDEAQIYTRLTSICGLNFANRPKPERRDLLAFDEIIFPANYDVPTPSRRISRWLKQVIDRAEDVKKQHPTLSPVRDNAFWEITAKTILPDSHQLLFAKPTDLKSILDFYCAAVAGTASITLKSDVGNYSFAVVSAIATYLEIIGGVKYSLTLSLHEEVLRKRMRSMSDSVTSTTKDDVSHLKHQIVDLETKIDHTINKLEDTDLERNELQGRVKEISSAFADAEREVELTKARQAELEILYKEQQEKSADLSLRLESALSEAQDMRSSNNALAEDADATQKELEAEVASLQRALRKTEKGCSAATKKSEQRQKKLDRSEQIVAEYVGLLGSRQEELDVAQRELEKLKRRRGKKEKDDVETKRYEEEAGRLREELRELEGKFETMRGLAEPATVEWQSCERSTRGLSAQRNSYTDAELVSKRHVGEEVMFLFHGLTHAAQLVTVARKMGVEDMVRLALQQVKRFLGRLEAVVESGNGVVDARSMELSLLRVLVAGPFVDGDVTPEVAERLKGLAIMVNELDREMT